MAKLVLRLMTDMFAEETKVPIHGYGIRGGTTRSTGSQASKARPVLFLTTPSAERAPATTI